MSVTTEAPTMGAKVQRLHPTPTVTLETVTPELAAEWLKRNVNNRRRRPTVVDRYARDMAADEWRPDAGMIQFDLAGNLLNGQHRLAACIKADTPFRTWVMRGADPAAMPVIDKGTPRSLGNTLTWMGKADVNSLAAAISTGWRWQAANPHDRVLVPTTDEAVAWLKANPSIEIASRDARAPYATFRCPRPAGSAVIHRLRLVDGAATHQFLADVETGASLTAGDPALALRNWMTNQMATSQGKVRPLHLPSVYMAMWVKAWNAKMTGRSLKLVRYVAREEFPVLLGADGTPVPLANEVDL